MEQTPVLYVVLGVLAVAQITVMITALVRLVKTPRERLTLPLPAWVAIVVLVSWIGPVLFFVAGRRPPALPESATPRGQAEAIDDLYR